MIMEREYKENLIEEVDKLHKRNELSKKVGADYFEPGMMEFLDKSDGEYVENTGEIVIRFEAKGTRYDGRTEQIESIKIGDEIQVMRERDNKFNGNNFTLLTRRGQNVGNMPAELCNAIAPLFDAGDIRFTSAAVSFVEPISKRSRHAKQAILFVELRMELLCLD